MALSAVIISGRTATEALMTDQVVVRRKVGETTNEDYVVVPVFETIYHPHGVPHFGKARLQTYEGHEVTRESAGVTMTVQRSQVHFPVGALESRIGDIVTFLIGRSDPFLAGRSFRIAQHVPVKSHATAYRVFVDENVGEEVPPWEDDDSFAVIV